MGSLNFKANDGKNYTNDIPIAFIIGYLRLEDGKIKLIFSILKKCIFLQNDCRLTCLEFTNDTNTDFFSITYLCAFLRQSILKNI